MKRIKSLNIFKISLLLIIFLAVVLRFYGLGANPPSLDWDEASLGYNAYSILKTGADEYGNRFPLSFRSFNDYKPPLYVYMTVPSIKLFGLTEFAVRFPSAFLGSLTILVTYLLLKELFKNLTYVNSLAILSSFLLAISPWHIQFSRTAFEANMGLFFVISGFLFFLKGLQNGRFLFISFFFFSFALYSYHSVRLMLPIFLLGIFIYFKNDLLRQKKYFLFALLLAFFLCLPIIKSFISEKTGASRLSSVTILKPTGLLERSINQLQFDREHQNVWGEFFHNRRLIYFTAVVGGYFDHWNFDFLFLNGDSPKRHHAVGMGMLYLVEFPLILLGIYSLLRKKTEKSFVVFWWFLTAPLASAITTGTPHAVRALLYLPTYQIFAAFGIIWVYSFFKNRFGNKAFVAMTFIALAITLNFIYYLHMYWVHTPIEASQDWQYGYKEAVLEVKEKEENFQKIIVSYEYDQPYIYFLFYQKIDPAWIQKQAPKGEVERFYRSFGKYEFRKIDWSKDRNLKDTLLVGTPSEIPEGLTETKEIRFLDGKVAFRIVAT